MSSRIALITGGTGGIGTAICRDFAKQNIRVVACDIDKVYMDKWQTQQKESGFEFEVVYGDVSNFESTSEMVKEVETKIGAIDILVNVAGITEDVTLRKMLPSQWNHVLRVDLDSVFNVTRQVINGMINRGYGRIISISSINGHLGNFGQTNYAAAKAGIFGFTKALAKEVASKGITVNTISPGYVDTEMVKKIPPKILDKIINEIPVGRLADPKEIARAVTFLAADEAGYITGADITVSGGVYMN